MHLVRYFRLIVPAAVLGHLGAISLKNITKRKEVRKLEKELIRPNMCITFLVENLEITWFLTFRFLTSNYYSSTKGPD